MKPPETGRCAALIQAALILQDGLEGTGVNILDVDDHGPDGVWIEFSYPNGTTGRVLTQPLGETREAR